MLSGAVVGHAGTRRWGLLIALGLAAMIVLWAVGGARAATTLTVTSTADDNGGQACTNGQCPTLRDAVNQANLDSGDTIILPALSPQPYTLSNGELQLNSSMTIEGAGANQVTIDAGRTSRIFDVENDSDVTITGVTLSDGNGEADSENTTLGGAVYVASGSTLTLTTSAVSNNTTAEGGGIYVDGTLNLQGSTITGNTAAAVDGDGGGVFVRHTATIVNSTITGNSAAQAGGGIYDDDILSLTNVTLSANSAPADSNGTFGGANLFVDDTGAGSFENTIVSGAQGGGANCYTSGEFPTSGGHNLEDDAGQSCDFTDPTDLSGVDPKLGPLADNGGPTQTMALLAGSPAIDKGATVDSVTTDQRGGPRPQPAGGAYDIGAYEVGAVVDMAITKSASPSPVTAGQPLTYTIRATNDGPTSDPGYGVSVSDTLPAGVTFGSASTSQGTCSHSGSTVTCALGTVDKSTTATITIVVTPGAAGSVTNSASVSSTGLDPNTANNSASVTTQVKAAAAAASNGSKPQVSTGNATDITFTGATLHGTVNPEGASTIYHFDYGNANYDPVTVAGVTGSGAGARAVSAKVTGLKPGKLYHFRLVAQNSHGTVDGQDRTFRTPPRPSLHVAPNRVRPGAVVRVFGSAGACSVGDRVTLLSHAFSGRRQFAGVPAVYARVRSGHGYSTSARVPSGRAVGHYLVTARCGGGNLGVSAHLTVYKPVVRPVVRRVVPKFTG